MRMADAVDVADITALIARYPVAVDGARYDELDELFTADARIDFSAFGGPDGGLAEAKAFLAVGLGGFTATQHLMGLPAIDVDGDVATARTPCHNPMVATNADGSTAVWLIGLWYDDRFARTPAGWRFTERRQERCYSVTSLVGTELGPR